MKLTLNQNLLVALIASAMLIRSGSRLEAQPGPPTPPHTVAALTVSGEGACADLLPSVAALRGGGVFVVWQRACGGEPEVWGRRYDALGRALESPVRIARGIQPAIAELPNGQFAFAYFDDPGQNQFAIFLRRLDESGQPQGSALAVSEPIDEGLPDTPRIAVSSRGDVALAWNVQVVGIVPFLFPSDLHTPAVRFFDASFEPTTAVLRPTEVRATGNSQPDIAFGNSGDALVVWGGALSPTDFEVVVGRRYRPDSGWLDTLPQGVTPSTGESLRAPRIAPRRGGGGGWWLAWISDGTIFEPLTRTYAALVDGGFALEPARAIVSLGPTRPQLIAPGLGTDIAGNALALTVSSEGEIRGVAFRPSQTATPPFALGTAGFDANSLALAQGSSAFFATWSSSKTDNPLDTKPFDVLGRVLRTACDPSSSAACLDGAVFAPSVTVERTGTGGGPLTPLLVAANTALYFRANALVPEVAVQLGQNAAGEFELTYAATTAAGLRIRQYGSSGTLRTEVLKGAGRFKSAKVGGIIPSLASPSEPASGWVEASSADLVEGTATATCGASPTKLCLFAGRFRIEATYLDREGVPRAARVAPHGDRTGSLEFDGRPAMIVSLIDGTTSNGKIWVYLGGLSNSPSTVTITEIASGRIRTYSNPAGKLQSRADRQAF